MARDPILWIAWAVSGALVLVAGEWVDDVIHPGTVAAQAYVPAPQEERFAVPRLPKEPMCDALVRPADACAGTDRQSV